MAESSPVTSLMEFFLPQEETTGLIVQEFNGTTVLALGFFILFYVIAFAVGALFSFEFEAIY